MLPETLTAEIRPRCPLHGIQESSVGSENYQHVVDIVQTAYWRLPDVTRTLFIERIGPEISREIFRLGNILEWKRYSVAMLREQDLSVNMHYMPFGPQSIYLRFNCQHRIRWAQFNFPQQKGTWALKRNADGFFEGMWTRGVLELPEGPELQQLQETTQLRTDILEKSIIRQSEQGT